MNSGQKKRLMRSICLGAVMIFLLLIMQNISRAEYGKAVGITPQHVTVYKAPSCGCCENYVAYLKRNGFTVDLVATDDMASIKNQYGIPAELESCHTTVFDNGQVAEGHIPVDGLAVLTKDPALRGIALPEMPAGSPGMPGAKRGAFRVYTLGADGEAEGSFNL